MRSKRSTFSQPFRKTFRHHNSPRIDQNRSTKRRKAKQAFRRLKTATLIGPR